MSNDKILSVDEIRATLKKMKAGVKKQPGLMKSTYRYLDAVSGYVERIANAKEEGAWVASHGTQQPLEILEAMDVRGVFNEFWGVVSDIAEQAGLDWKSLGTALKRDGRLHLETY